MNGRALLVLLAVVAVVAMTAGGAVWYAQTADSRRNEEKFAPTIAAAEKKYGLPSGLLHALIYTESHFRSDIISGQTVSDAGAVGIAQIVPRWHPDVNALDPVASIYYAASYLSSLKSRFGSWQLALAAYNWGPGNLSAQLAKDGGFDPTSLPEETANYVATISDMAGVTNA